MVRVEGVEPPHLAILEPKSRASTNSATRALFLCFYKEILGGSRTNYSAIFETGRDEYFCEETT